MHHHHHHHHQQPEPELEVNRLASQLQELKQYTACDVSDALLKLGVPAAGFIADLAATICVISQPPRQYNAVLGGIVAARIKALGVKGVVVHGRVRDLEQLRSLGGSGDFPILSLGTSTVAAAATSVAHAVNVPIPLSCGVTVHPGDIIFIAPQPDSAVVCIPRGLLPKLLEILPAMVKADALALADVNWGVPITEAFRKWRSKL